MLLARNTWCHVVALQPFLLLLPTIEGALDSTGLSLSILPPPSSASSQSSPSSPPPPLPFPIPISPQRPHTQQQGVWYCTNGRKGFQIKTEACWTHRVPLSRPRSLLVCSWGWEGPRRSVPKAFVQDSPSSDTSCCAGKVISLQLA